MVRGNGVVVRGTAMHGMAAWHGRSWEWLHINLRSRAINVPIQFLHLPWVRVISSFPASLLLLCSLAVAPLSLVAASYGDKMNREDV